MNDLPLGLLRQKRELMKLTPEYVIQELEKRGISISIKTLYGYENGVSTPRVNTFIALCDIYKISDIMGEFGYKAPIKLATGDNEWSCDEYNDFFNGTLLEKIYLLLKKGVPSFSGYELQLEQCFPPNADLASFDRFYKLFSSLDESSQAAAFHTINDLNGNPYGCIEDIDFITLFHRACKSDQDIILAVLDKYRDKPLEEYFGVFSRNDAPTPEYEAEALEMLRLAYEQFLSEKKQALQASSAKPSAEKPA